MRARRNERGSQVVEAALSLSVLLSVVLGLLTFAVAMFIEQSLTHGAREAARYGALHAYKDDSALFPEVRKVALCGNPSTCSGAFGFTPSDVTVSCTPSGANCKDATRITVTVPAHSIPAFVWFGGLSGRAIQVSLPIENTTGAIE